VFAQTVPPFEVLLVDDGSTDDTHSVVQRLLAEHQDWVGRLRYVRQENQGKSAALNTALPLAGGEWIAFNDSDDRWLPEKLERQLAALDRFPECLACFTETSLNEFNGRHPELTAQARDSLGRVDAPSSLYPINWPGTYMQTVMVRADVMRRFGEFDPKYRLSQDVDFLFRLGLLTSFCYVNVPLVEIDQHSQRELGLTTTYPARSWTAMLEAESMLRKWLSMVDESRPELRRVLKHELASARSAFANRYLLAGDLPAARQALRQGIKDAPELRLIAKCVLAYTAPAVLRRFAAERAPAEFLTGQEPNPVSRR
jgi:glycosyltransferase involved in cell wall biosynthesis